MACAMHDLCHVRKPRVGEKLVVIAGPERLEWERLSPQIFEVRFSRPGVVEKVRIRTWFEAWHRALERHDWLSNKELFKPGGHTYMSAGDRKVGSET